MIRAIRLLLASAILIVVPPIGGAPASAGAGSTLMVGCRSSEPECWPTAFAFRPGGKELFYAERFTGQIHRFKFKGKRDRLWATVPDVSSDGEQGVLGIAVDPDWNRTRRRSRWVYVYFTHDPSDENRVIRIRKTDHGIKTELLLSIPIETSATNHNAGVIHFGPDGKLYVVTGDQANPSRAQDLADPAGKVLRLNRNGSRPADNPIPDSLAYSFGHRNSFGFAIDPADGAVWQTENGPNCNDEINHVIPGGNYAWGPAATSCPSSGRSVSDTNASGPLPLRLPEVNYDPVIVATGAAFCRGCGLGPGIEGDLLFGGFADGVIRNLTLDAQRDDVASQEVVYDHTSGVLAVERRPNGEVFFSDTEGIHRLTPS